MTEYIYERPDEPAKVVRDGWNVRIEWDFKQREEIVRCKDCVWAPEREYGEYYRCNMWIADVGANGFCSRGIRKRTEMAE